MNPPGPRSRRWRNRRSATLALLAWSALAPVSAARADEETPEKTQARLLLSQGNALFERGDLRGALADFRAAYAIYPSPKLLVNAAAAERELGDLAGAASDLRHYLDEAGADDPALGERARSELQKLEPQVARVGLAGWPARTLLEVDGRVVRDPTYVRPGVHTVAARSPSGVTLERTSNLVAGASLALALPAGAVLVPTATAAHPPDRRRRAWMAGVIAGVVVLAAGAVALGVVLGTRSSPPPLRGDLGTLPFSSFH